MTKIHSSPKRHTFQEQRYINRCREEGKEPSEDYLNLFKSMRGQDQEHMTDPEWKKNNLEYDLRSTEWICRKVKDSKRYAQNLYAAMCNQDWQKNEVWPLLKNETYSCSWRYAGGILADMTESGDYIDWYCSGIQGEPDADWIDLGHVPEGTVTQEIQEDLFKLGWIPVDNHDQT
jgi:hypothetical protein